MPLLSALGPVPAHRACGDVRVAGVAGAAGAACAVGAAGAAGASWLPLRTLCALGLLALAGAAAAQAVKPPAVGIYTCVDDRGRRLSADRPIPECTGKEQLVLNRDGSVKHVLPPTLTAEEHAQQEAQERKAAALRAQRAEAVRRDRNLMVRYPDEATHERAREAALDTVRLAMKTTGTRVRALQTERKPLLAESEFYLGRPLPAKLRMQMDANDASTQALQEAAAQQEAEMRRINRLYDLELDRLRRLWAGSAPGSLGAMPSASGPAAAAAQVPVSR